jgi:CBS domain-containing protein
MKARELMTPTPASCAPETTAQEAARLMKQHDCGSLPVVDERGSMRLVGIVTDRDLAIRVLAEGRSGDTPVREAMTSDVHTCPLDASLDDVERAMSQHKVRRVPIVDEGGRVVGVVAQADLARERKAVGTKDLGKVLEEISEPTGSRR